jgi:hypothetical protein
MRPFHDFSLTCYAHKAFWSVIIKLNDLSKLVMQIRCLTRSCSHMPREESNSASFCAIKDKNDLDTRLYPNIRLRISRSTVNNLLHLPLKPNNMPGNNMPSTAAMHNTRATIFRAVQPDNFTIMLLIVIFHPAVILQMVYLGQLADFSRVRPPAQIT